MLLRSLVPAVRQVAVAIRREFTATPSLNAIPFVIENEGRGERSYDIYSRLLRDRIVCVMTPVSLLFLQVGVISCDRLFYRQVPRAAHALVLDGQLCVVFSKGERPSAYTSQNPLIVTISDFAEQLDSFTVVMPIGSCVRRTCTKSECLTG